MAIYTFYNPAIPPDFDGVENKDYFDDMYISKISDVRISDDVGFEFYGNTYSDAVALSFFSNTVYFRYKLALVGDGFTTNEAGQINGGTIKYMQWVLANDLTLKADLQNLNVDAKTFFDAIYSLGPTDNTLLDDLLFSGNDTLLGTDGNDVAMYGLGGNDSLRGFDGIDGLAGGAGNDTLDGGLGTDAMAGGLGNDVYYVDNIDDEVNEGILLDAEAADPAVGGIDTIISTIANFPIPWHVENFILVSNQAANLVGTEADNVLGSGGGNDTINGAQGQDTADYSRAAAAVKVSLAATGAQNTGGAGTDTLISIERLTGSRFSDQLTGNQAANTLNGGAGADTLRGNAGTDTLIGGAGGDLLEGGTGADRLSGGTGPDRFKLTSTSGSDTITDFKTSELDKILVSQAGIRVGDGDTTIDAAVRVAGPGGFSNTAELVVITGNAATLGATGAAAAIGSATNAYAVGQKALFVIDNGASSQVYLFTAADANAEVSASELKLLATLTGVNSTDVSDFLFGG